MTITALSMIQDALESLGVADPGLPISGADGARGLNVLNQMMDSWSNETLTCFAITQQSTTLVVGKSSYTIGNFTGIGNFVVGTSGIGTQIDINSTRPLKIIDGPGAAYILDPQNNKYGVDVIPRDKWNMIGNSGINSNVPDTLFYDPQYPLGVINVYPVPNIAWALYWNSYTQLMEFTNLATVLQLPPGYEEAIVSNLAIRLKPYFQPPQMQIDPILVDRAKVSKANVKRTNMRVNEAVFDPEIISRASPTYNIRTDSGNR